MRNLSSAFKNDMLAGNRNYDYSAIVTLANEQQTTLTLTNVRLWTGGFNIEDAVSQDSEFTALGSAIIGSASIIINNMDSAYSSYDFTNARVALSLAKSFTSNNTTTTETIDIGIYTVDSASYNGSVITLTMLDNMEQFDRPYSLSSLQYPATLGDIVRDACTRCGVILKTQDFPHNDFGVQVRPTDGAITFRNMISWCAAIAGCFARCDASGKLELKWFDIEGLDTAMKALDLDGGIFDDTVSASYESGADADAGVFSPWNTGFEYDGGIFNPWNIDGQAENAFSERSSVHYISDLYSQNVGVDDIVITGIQITLEEQDNNGNLEDKIYTYGQNGYIIKIENNPLITPDTVNTVGTWLANQIVGTTFRNVTISHLDDPSIEAGDVGIVIDRRKANKYPILITRTVFDAGNTQTTVCGAESASRNSATRYTEATKSYVDARKLLNKEQTTRQQSVAQLAQGLEAKSGLYSTTETTQSGTIFYLHDKPLLEESSIVWKMTSDAWGVSTNGGTSWNAGMTVDGNMIANILDAIGINASWINTGELSVSKFDPQTSEVVEVLYVNVDTGVVRIVADSFQLSSGETIQSAAQAAAQSAVSGAVGNLSQQDIFNALTNNGQVQGIYLQNGRIYLNFSYAQGGTLKLGGANNSNGTFEVYDSNGNVIATIDNNGARFCTTRGWSDEYIKIDENILKGYIGNTLYSAIDMCANVSNEIWLTITTTSSADGINISTASSGGISIGPSGIVISTPDYGHVIISAGNNGTGTLELVGTIPSISANFIESSGRINCDSLYVANPPWSSSDKRLKKNIKDIEPQTNNIRKLKVKSFDWIKDNKHVGAGLIAQDVQDVYPNLVVEDKGYLALSYVGLVPYLIKTIQEQQEEIDDLKNRLAKLEDYVFNRNGD